MHLQDLHGLLVHELKDLYSAENQILDAMPAVIEQVSDDRLRQTLSTHLEETRNQIDALEQIFRDLGEDPVGQTCKGMQGLIRESTGFLQNGAEEDVQDAGIIAAVQRVEHYEIASYGTVATYAKMLGRDDVLGPLLEILEEEKQADLALTEVAKRDVNARAVR